MRDPNGYTRTRARGVLTDRTSKMSQPHSTGKSKPLPKLILILGERRFQISVKRLLLGWNYPSFVYDTEESVVVLRKAVHTEVRIVLPADDFQAGLGPGILRSAMVGSNQ